MEPSPTILRQVSGRKRAIGMNAAIEKINRNQKILVTVSRLRITISNGNLPVPAGVLRDDTSQERTYGRSQQASYRSPGDVLPSICRNYAVTDQTLGQSYGAAAASRLKHSEEQQSDIAILQSKGEIRHDVYRKA
jgi:hypothetical protein